MFNFGEIWVYPTDTSFGLGVRADDGTGLGNLARLKGNRGQKYFSLMCRDRKMLKEFAEVPDNFDILAFFSEKPRTAIFKPTNKLPKSKFWPDNKIAFRVSTIPGVSNKIVFPVTATSANLSGEEPIFNVKDVREAFEDKVKIYTDIPELTVTSPSEIWDFTEVHLKQIR